MNGFRVNRWPVNRHTLRVAGAAVLLCLTLVIVTMYLLYQQTLQSGRDHAEALAFAMAEQTERILDAADKRLQLTQMQLLDLKNTGHLNSQTVTSAFRDQLKGQPYLADLWLLDDRGRIVFDSRPGTVGIDLGGRKIFSIHAADPRSGFFAEAPVVSLRTGKWQLTVSRPWRSPGGDLTGVVVAALDLDYLTSVWRSPALGNGGAVTLLGTDGIMLARRPAMPESLGKDYSFRPLFKTYLAREAHGVYIDASAVDGIKRIYGYHKLGNDRNMVLVVGLTYDDLLNQWTQLAIVAFGLSLVAVGTIALLAQTLIRSLWQHAEARQKALIGERALAAISQGVLITDANRKIVAVNPAFEQLTGYHESELLGQSCALLQGEGTDPSQIAALREALDARQPFRCELLNYRRDGSAFWNELTIDPVLDDHGKLKHFIGAQRDVTVAKEHRLHTQLTEQIFSQATDGITVTDANGCILRINQAFTNITGYQADEVIGRNPRMLASGVQNAAFYTSMWHCIAIDGVWAGEIYNRHKNGTIYPEWLTISALHDPLGKVTHYLGSFSDLSHMRAAETRIARLSHFDPLTGLPNRTLLQDRTAHCISLAQRAKETFYMVLVSIDHFKMVNDTLGHGVGDHVLTEVAKRLSAAVRDQDTVSHHAGKEFTLVLPGTPDHGAAHLAADLLWKIAQPYRIGEHEILITATIGLASYPDNGVDFDSLFKATEIALHRAQASGHDNFKFYSEGMYQEVLTRDQMARALRLAADRGELAVLYQPLVDLQTGNISGMEALLRWNNPELGAIAPSVFIPVAEESGLICNIGEWVIRQVVADVRVWQDAGVPVPPVAINVSPKQFHDPAFVSSVQAALAQQQVAAQQICLEVTESALMDDVTRCEDILQRLKQLGVSLSLDDFGTGYSSLNYLKRYPFDKVKIDQSFVRDIGSNTTDTVIVKVIISMAHGLGLKVVAEGVETEAQCDIMRANVCDEIQGYFFSRPVTANQLKEQLAAGKHLPAHLLRFRPLQRVLLLVDDEPNVLAALKRLFRRDGYNILTASSGEAGLAMLSQQKVDIIISDQRMPGMTGVEFLREAKQRHPDTIRIVLSGYTELQSVTDAINEGAVYRFLTKPWEDDQLRDQIHKAFEHKELLEENQQLDFRIRTTNQELVAANKHLGALIHSNRQKLESDATTLAVMREALQFIPVPVLGVDDENAIVFANGAAESLFDESGMLWGAEVSQISPSLSELVYAKAEGTAEAFQVGNATFDIRWTAMGALSMSRGKLITFNQTKFLQ